MKPLLSAGDVPPFTWCNPKGMAPVIFFCDHAGRAFPKSLGQLGLAPEHSDRHIVWDIGIADLARHLAGKMDAPALLANYSRLVIDCNRHLDDPTSIAQVSDDTFIPGNQHLKEEDKALRAREIFEPYHQELGRKIEERLSVQPAILSLHSFTPYMGGFARPWHIGILWNKDDRLVKPLLKALAEEGDLCIGDNEPYSGRDRHGYSIEFHAEQRGLPHVLLEIRQDLIDTREKAKRWGDRLYKILGKILQ